MRDIVDNIEQECCTEGCGCGPGCCETEDCDIEDCACGCNDGEPDEYISVDLRSPALIELDERLGRFRTQFEQEYRAELARLQKRVVELEEQGRAHASRQICALMTEVDSLERNVLGRDVTTSQLKKAGMQILGVDKKP